MDLLTMNRCLARQLHAALDEVDRLRADNDALRERLADEITDRERERREADATLEWVG